jgi:dTDP-4-dehydrorhamnose 3,5-epimerase
VKIFQTKIEGLVVIEPNVFYDSRGYFYESHNQKQFEENVLQTNFVQDNESMSSKGVLRGLHYQLPPYTQSKLVRVIKGEVLDIAVDIRKGSPTFGHYESIILSHENKKQFFIPKGFAHGFVVLSETAIFSYKCDNYYAPEYEQSILFDDKDLNIDWKLDLKELLISDKDKKGIPFKTAEVFDTKINLYE